MIELTSSAVNRTPVYINPMQVLNVVRYNETVTTIYLAAATGERVHTVSVTEPADEVAGMISAQLRTLKG